MSHLAGKQALVASEAPPALGADWFSWVKEHHVCWELAPLRELLQDHGVEQTGYTLKLFALLKHDAAQAARSVRARLLAIVEELSRSTPVPGFMQIEPAARIVAHMESRIVLEAELTVVASPEHPQAPLPPAELRRVIETVEDRLRTLGLKKRG